MAHADLQTGITYGVVIPSAGRIHYLREALRSVFKQESLAQSVVVVVDAHWDRYDEVRKEFHETVVFLKTAGNEGGQKARELGVRHLLADGVSFIAFLDDDDLWLPEKMSRQLQLAAGKTNVLVGSQYSILKGNRIEGVWVNTSVDLMASFQIVNLLGSFSNIMVSASLALPFAPLRSCQDWHYVWQRLLDGAEIVIVPEPLLLYRVHTLEKITSNYGTRLLGLIELRELMKGNWLWWGRLFMFGRIGMLRFAFNRRVADLLAYPIYLACCFMPGPLWVSRIRLALTIGIESLLGFQNMERVRTLIKKLVNRSKEDLSPVESH